MKVCSAILLGEGNRLARQRPGVRRPSAAFTLIELLVVISIMGLLAGLAVPALKNLGKSTVQASAARQLLDDIGRARQLAISQHTTVYMVFVPTNFFYLIDDKGTQLSSDLTSSRIPVPADLQAAWVAMTNLVDKQLTGYNFISYGKVGDQPGQHTWRYLDDWKALPDGTFIAAPKFQLPDAYTPMQIPAWQQDYANGRIENWRNLGGIQQIYSFTNGGVYIPFPTEKSPGVKLPCLIFNHLGRLISEYDGRNTDDPGSYHHAYIPLAQGSVGYGYDLKKQPTLAPVLPSAITENPVGGSSSISYNVVDVDPLSGRAKLLVHHMP